MPAKRSATLDHLVVQDIFLTETAYLADVVLAATAWPEKVGTVTNTDRMVQLGRKAIEPPGDAREDFWILNELARRVGVDWYYYASERSVQRDADLHGFDRRHYLGPAGARVVRHLSVRERRRSGRPGGVHRELPDANRGAPSSFPPT